MKQKKTKEYQGFILAAVISLLATVYLSYHAVDVLFGDNSLQIHSDLERKKEWLESEILRLQRENAYLQKEYFELKNLEPEE